MSIASSGLFALLIEVGFWLNDRIRFGYLQGRWERIAFYNRNLNESGLGYDDISQRYSSIPKGIRLTYKGDSEYKGTASYEKGEVSFSLNISKENVLSGAGIYQYHITSQSITADIGQYSFVVDKNRKKIYVSHLNILPSGNARGLEIWQRNRARHKIRFLQYWLVLLICIFAHQP
jgi:hypothetical protein